MNKNYIIYFLFILSSCSQSKGIEVSRVSSDFCNCFSQQTIGDIDTRMQPCMDKYVNARVDEIESLYEKKSVEEAIGDYITELTLEMVRSCEKFAQETTIMYDNFYPLDTSSENRVAIATLSERIDKATEQDTLKSLLHLRLAKLISQRDLESALTDVELIQKIDSNDIGAYLAASQVYNLQGNYSQALVQIEKAIALTGRKEYELFAEIIKRKINS